MNLRFAVVAMLFASLFILGSVNVAKAQWEDDLSSGYGIATEWGHSVRAWAGTTDSRVERVEFRWFHPSGDMVWNPILAISDPYITPSTPPDVPQEITDWADRYPGRTVWYACDRQEPTVSGDWVVHAIFHGHDGICGSCSCRVHVCPTHVVPEVPFGTIATLLGMFGALGVFAKRKKFF